MTQTSDRAETLAHIPQLDGLRGLACLMVLVSHSSVVPEALNERIGDIGMHGVRIFMVLSGFLITRILLDYRDRGRGWGDFYVRRASRIFPAYYLCLAATMLIWPAAPHWPTFAYLTNYFGSSNGMQHTSTLAVEEQFYLVWPFLVLLLPRKHSKWAILAGMVASVMLASYRAYTNYEHWGRATYLWIDHCSLLFGAGALMAYYERDMRKALMPSVAIASALLALLLLWQLNSHFARDVVPGSRLFKYLFHSAVAMLVMTLALRGSSLIDAVLRLKPLAFVGAISYGVYLYHYPIFLAFGDLLHHWVSLPLLAAAWTTTIVVAVLSNRFFEKPVMAKTRAWLSPRHA